MLRSRHRPARPSPPREPPLDPFAVFRLLGAIVQGWIDRLAVRRIERALARGAQLRIEMTGGLLNIAGGEGLGEPRTPAPSERFVSYDVDGLRGVIVTTMDLP